MSLVLVDTSMWIEHLRQGNEKLTDALTMGTVLTHPMVIGELAMGNLKARKELLISLQALPRSVSARDNEVLAYVEHHQLAGRGIGYVDANLLVSTVLTPGAKLWTRDRRLADIAGKAGVAYSPTPQR